MSSRPVNGDDDDDDDNTAVHWLIWLEVSLRIGASLDHVVARLLISGSVGFLWPTHNKQQPHESNNNKNNNINIFATGLTVFFFFFYSFPSRAFVKVKVKPLERHC